MTTPVNVVRQLRARALPVIERSVARLLEFDPGTRDALARLDGQVISVEFKAINQSLYLLPGAHGMHLRLDHEGDVQVRIRGTPFDFLAVARARARQQPIPAGRIEIVGDLGAAQQVQDIMRNLDIDWEEMLSRLIGDTAAHKVGHVMREMAVWAGQLARTMEANVSEYARYETEIVPERDQVDRFNSAVDVLRADADRLAERVRRLRRALQGA